jgi:EmrB/QacA subfamily drug resistance transporter
MIVPLIVGSALLMEFLDATAVLTALPAMARSLNSDAAHLSVVISAYLLSLSIFIPASGWIADRWGARTVFQAAIGIFTLASMLCGLSGSLGELTAARVLQGFGAALMTPVARLILLRTFPKSELVRAMAWFSMPALIGPMFAPLLGGFLTDYASWRWIFFINVPLGLLAIGATAFVLKNDRGGEIKPFDWIGFVLTALALVAFISTTDAIGHGVLRAPGMILAVAGTAGLVLSAVLHARRHPFPIVDLSLLRLSTFRAANTGGLLYRIAFNAVLVLQPVLLQVGFGMNALHSGGLTLFGACGLFTMRPWVRPILRRFGFRAVLACNAFLSAIAVVIVCLFSADTPLVVFAAAFFVGGLTRSLQYMCYSTVVFAEVPPAKASVATSVSSMSDRFSGALGASVASILLSLTTFLRDGRPDSLNSVDIQWSLGMLGVLVAASGLVALRLDRDAGAEVSGHAG